MSGVSRRQLFALAGAAAGALAGPLPAFAATAFPWGPPANDPVADIYLDLLHTNTRWAEQQWDDSIGAYASADFRFVAVLGNAVLLRVENYDESKTGVSKARLKSRTMATIERYAASNRLAGGDAWGQQLLRDSTFELYFVLAARLLWDDLAAGTQADVQRIAIGQGTYTYGLGFGDDPLSGDFSPDGTAGGWQDDTRLPEMGVYAQALAPLLAWTQSDADTRERFLFWAQNASGLPAADRVNDAVVDGRRVCDRAAAHNIHDTFIVENGGSADPFSQAELWRTAGRAAIHFLAAGKPLPQVLTRQPNGDELWRTLRLLASDAGEPVLPMAADHYHLYGRDVLPLAFLAQVQGDQDAARAEADLAARLKPYLTYEPADQLTKVSDSAGESEARAELAIAYLFHRHRGRPVKPTSTFFRDAAGTRDFGPDVGLVVQQSEQAFAAAVTAPGFVRFLWQPRHDNWLVDSRAAGFLPPGKQVEARWTQAYAKVRDGLDATVTVLTLGELQYAGFATLPTGTVVYASTGLGAGEGQLTIFNLSMPGVPGLSGTRTFTSASGELTLSQREASGDGDTDLLHFTPRRARYVRLLSRETATQDGLSVWTFAVLDEQSADLAQGALTGASSSDLTFPSRNATDGNPQTRWAVDRSQVAQQDSWLGVDLGSPVTIAGVRIDWESAYATKYAIQTSTDAATWTDAVVVPKVHKVGGGWVDVDGRFGLVTRGPITVTANGVSAPARLIEGYVAGLPALPALAKRIMPVAPGLTVSDADGFLSAFNLSPGGVTATVTTPWTGRIYRGVQQMGLAGLLWTATVPGGTGLVEPPRFTVTGVVPVGTRFDVADSHHVTVTAPVGQGVNVAVKSGSFSSRVRLRAGEARSLVVPGATVPAATVSSSAALPGSPSGAPGSAVPGSTGASTVPGSSGSPDSSGSSVSPGAAGSAGVAGSSGAPASSGSSVAPSPVSRAWILPGLWGSSSAAPSSGASSPSSSGTSPSGSGSAASSGSGSGSSSGSGSAASSGSGPTSPSGSGSTSSSGSGSAASSAAVPGPAVTPTDDLARGRTTYPTSPLPAGMNSPSRAVDGSSTTAWRPGASGRMVVDLGTQVAVAEVRQTWSRGRICPVRLALSTDGLTYFPFSASTPAKARYLQLTVLDWQPGDAELIDLAVRPG